MNSFYHVISFVKQTMAGVFFPSFALLWTADRAVTYNLNRHFVLNYGCHLLTLKCVCAVFLVVFHHGNSRAIFYSRNTYALKASLLSLKVRCLTFRNVWFFLLLLRKKRRARRKDRRKHTRTHAQKINVKETLFYCSYDSWITTIS